MVLKYCNLQSTGSAPGKIILTGEYAVVFGYPGIAIPSPLTMEIIFEEDATLGDIEILWKGIKGDAKWNAYLRNILDLILPHKRKPIHGRLTIKNALPLGKGMGSSTSLVIALCRCLLAADPSLRDIALALEDKVNPRHSGIDFNVIWENTPLLYKKGAGFKPIDLPKDIINNAVLIDTGKPNESTSQLVEYVSKQLSGNPASAGALESIGKCTQRLLDGEPLISILPDHHRAQIALGTVPKAVQKLIAEIEFSGGAAKVLGAGGITNGGGMALAIHKNTGVLQSILDKHRLQYQRVNQR